jgi:hypothetical protein
VASDKIVRKQLALRIGAKMPNMSPYGLGCREAAAEIKPIEPVWVIPAKGAAA